MSKPHHYSNSERSIDSSHGKWWAKFNDSQLNALIEIALSDSPNINIAKERLHRAQYIADAAYASLLPSVNAGALFARERYTANSLIPPPYGGEIVNFGDIALNFQYELDFWGKNRETLAFRTCEAKAKEAELAAAKLIISTAVANAYFKLQSNIALLKNAESMLQQRLALLRVTRMRNTRQLESDIPLNQANSDVQAAEQFVAQATRGIHLARHQLAILIGKNPFTTTITSHPFSYRKQIVLLPNNIPANLLGRRPDIVASRWQVEAIAHEVNISKTRFFPNINLSAFLSYQSIGLDRLFKASSRDNNAQAAIDLPIFDAGLRRANLKTRYAEYDIAVNQYNQSILNALQEVADQLSILQTLKIEQTSNFKALHNYQYNFALTKSRYRHGISNYSQLLQTKGPLLTQQRIEIQLQTQHTLAIIAMIKALGGDYQVTQG